MNVAARLQSDSIVTNDREIAAREALLQHLEVEISALRKETDGRPRSAAESDALKELEWEKTMLLRGVRHVDACTKRLLPFLGQPGLDALRAERARLIAERDAPPPPDPDEIVTVRLMHLATHLLPDGKRMRVGEETTMTRRQLDAFGDRFLEVEHRADGAEKSDSVAGG